MLECLKLFNFQSFSSAKVALADISIGIYWEGLWSFPYSVVSQSTPQVNLLKGKFRTAKGSKDNAKIPEAKFLHPVIGEVRLDADNVHEKCSYVG